MELRAQQTVSYQQFLKNCNLFMVCFANNSDLPVDLRSYISPCSLGSFDEGRELRKKKQRTRNWT